MHAAQSEAPPGPAAAESGAGGWVAGRRRHAALLAGAASRVAAATRALREWGDAYGTCNQTGPLESTLSFYNAVRFDFSNSFISKARRR